VIAFETVRWTTFAVLVDAASCTDCSRCEVRCPFNAIRMRPAAQAHGTYFEQRGEQHVERFPAR
jgi:Fe-S-cluster-containing hydrogenase component 2